MKLEKGDEMECLVRGCNFLLTSVPREAYTFQSGTRAYVNRGENRGCRFVPAALQPLLTVFAAGLSSAVLHGAGGVH